MDNTQPIFESPIKTITAQPAATRAELAVADITGVQIILIQGSPGAQLDSLFGRIPNVPGEIVDTASAVLARLTPDELCAFGKTAGINIPQAADMDRQLATAGHFAHTTDLTHGKAVIKLAGPAASETLSKLCGLNFANETFPPGQAKQTSAAKIKTLIVRADEGETPVYFLHVERSLGQYFWDTLWDAGQEFGITLTS